MHADGIRESEAETRLRDQRLSVSISGSLPGESNRTIARIARRHRLKLMIVFGSQATGMTHAQSDLDIAVLPTGGDTSFRRFAAINRSLSRAFPDREIDLSFVNRADPLLLRNIAETGRLLYGRRRRFAQLKCLAFQRYEDYRPFFRLEERFVRRYIRELTRARG